MREKYDEKMAREILDKMVKGDIKMLLRPLHTGYAQIEIQGEQGPGFITTAEVEVSLKDAIVEAIQFYEAYYKSVKNNKINVEGE